MPDASIPIADKADDVSIFSAALTANWQASSVVTTGRSSRCALSVHYNADDGGTANLGKFLVFVSNAATVPAIGDDKWVALSQADATPTDAVLTDTFPAGFDATITPEWGNRVVRPSSFSLYEVDNVTDKIRVSLVVDVRSWKWLHVQCKEEGDTDADQLGAMTVYAALSA